ncbi:FAD/FMN-containing dehydrogenase OS=Streptomyces violarus OX=67380 GN=FHS41_003129 PE=3 SV=1 [Streptomyces violarus]
MGGAMSRPSAVEDAVCARDALYFIDSVGIMAAPPAAEAIEQATQQLYTAMAPYGTGRTMVNIHGTPGDEQDRARAWTPEVYERLRHDKAVYDPTNLLRYGHAVTPA